MVCTIDLRMTWDCCVWVEDSLAFAPAFAAPTLPDKERVPPLCSDVVSVLVNSAAIAPSLEALRL